MFRDLTLVAATYNRSYNKVPPTGDSGIIINILADIRRYAFIVIRIWSFVMTVHAMYSHIHA